LIRIILTAAATAATNAATTAATTVARKIRKTASVTWAGVTVICVATRVYGCASAKIKVIATGCRRGTTQSYAFGDVVAVIACRRKSLKIFLIRTMITNVISLTTQTAFPVVFDIEEVQLLQKLQLIELT
jgi:hypothetical protein